MKSLISSQQLVSRHPLFGRVAEGRRHALFIDTQTPFDLSSTWSCSMVVSDKCCRGQQHQTLLSMAWPFARRISVQLAGSFVDDGFTLHVLAHCVIPYFFG